MLIFALLVATMAAGCGDDGGGGPPAPTDDMEGFWLITSYTDDFGMGPPAMKIERGGASIGLIGEAILTTSSDTEMHLDWRVAPLDGMQIPIEPIVFEAMITVEEDRWVVPNQNDPMDPMDDDVVVFLTERVGEVLTLTPDPTDPRHTATDPPDEIVIERTAPWGTDLVGEWIVTDLDGSDPRDCTMTDVDESQQQSIEWNMDDRWWVAQAIHTSSYDNETCAGSPTSMETMDIQWFAEVDGDALRTYAWDADSSTGLHLGWTFVLNGADADLTSTTCDPPSFCSDTPASAILTPAP